MVIPVPLTASIECEESPNKMREVPPDDHPADEGVINNSEVPVAKFVVGQTVLVLPEIGRIKRVFIPELSVDTPDAENVPVTEAPEVEQDNIPDLVKI